MRVSVIIPCRNAGPWIGETLTSVAGQSRPAQEVVVIDDDSTDDSVEQVGRSGLDVRLIRTRFRNAAAARNVGIDSCTGDWVAFLDADDVWEPEHLANAERLLGRGADVAYMANHRFLHNDGTVTPIPESLRPKIDRSSAGLPHLAFTDLMSRGFHFGHSTVLLRRDRVREVGGFDVSQRRRHDIDLWLRVIQGQTWAWCADAATRYRIDTPGSISKNIINAEYYYLRALLKNAGGFPGTPMRDLLRTAAQRSMSLAFVDGSSADFELARGLAWPHLKPTHRLCYQAATVFPAALRWAIRLKRRLLIRGVGS